jgi:thiol-disulfide isomerase/thioredoxin
MRAAAKNVTGDRSMARLDSALNYLVLFGLCVGAYFFLSAPKDYGPPPSDPWFQSAVLDQERLVLVKFGSPCCEPCRMLDAELRQLAGSAPAQVVKIDVDTHPELAQHYGVSSIPRILLFKDGKVVGDRTGYASAQDLRSWIARHAQ